VRRHAGGYVDGIVTDHNTGNPVNGATVVSQTNPGQAGVSQATPDDPNLSDGFYWLFATPAGATPFQASDGSYTPSTQTVNVAAHAVVHQDWSLQAGHLSITPGSLSVTQTLGAAKTKTVSFSNDGTEPIQVKLAEQDGGFTPMTGQASAKGAPLEQIKGTFTPAARVARVGAGAKTGAKTRAAGTPAATRYDPGSNAWTQLANYPIVAAFPACAGIDNEVVCAGGVNAETSAGIKSTYIYDPGSNTWTQGADMPRCCPDSTAAAPRTCPGCRRAPTRSR
jgi:Kelch motif